MVSRKRRPVGLVPYRFWREIIMANGFISCSLLHWARDPDDPAEREHWTTMSYTEILRLVEGTMAAAGDTANEDVLAFLRQYAITLRRNIVPEVSNDVHELARRIYRKHKRAIDLIIEHRESYEPNYVTEGFWMVRESIGKQPLWKERTCNRPYVRFVSTAWEEFEQLKMGTWPHHLLLFEVQVTDSRAELFLTLFKGGDKSLRKQIFDRVRANADVFDCEEPAYSAESIRLHTVGNVLEESDYDSWWDEERTREIIYGRLVDFAQGPACRDRQDRGGVLGEASGRNGVAWIWRRDSGSRSATVCRRTRERGAVYEFGWPQC